MRRLCVRMLIAAIFLAAAASPAGALELRPILTGLTNPLFVTHAGDGTGRLFIVEQAGTIRVAQPGAATATVFLDIQLRVLSGGERGLLGLAFHPLYRSNGRFFVYFTRRPDGAIVLAEYAVSSNPNVASVTETTLLTIPHPGFANHNGGMLSFGPGGYLYVGVGDGGSANDPPNNAQNVESLLGKLLRIDVDRADAAAGTRYSSPPSNPFVGRAGHDEIYAYGLRNPWRFSFDRETTQLWIGDVGQGAREEVDTPVVPGANFGWRIYEGFTCTNNDPSLCQPGNYTRPLFEYAHTGGRCSLTGGYVYRGRANALPAGTYVYGDYCSGEVFAWDGSAQRVLFDTSTDVSSFGEDEQGEIYVVSLAGTVSRLVASGCSLTLAPAAITTAAAGGTTAVFVDTGSGCPWTATASGSWFRIVGTAAQNGSGTFSVTVDRIPWPLRRREGTVSVGGTRITVVQTW